MPGKIPLLVKVSMAPLAAGLIVLIILAWQVDVTSEIKKDAAAINQAGSQRMRLFRLVLLTEQYTEHREPKVRALIDREMTTFEAILHGLKHGDPRYNLTSTGDPESITDLDKRVDEWNKTIQPLFRNALAASASKETLRALNNRVEEYVIRIDGLVALLAAYSEKKADTLRDLVWLFLFASFVIALGSLIYIHVIVLKPIKMLAKASMAIAAGEFSRTVPVLSNDEIGALAGDFNKMSVQLKYHIETLNQKTVELAAQKALIEADRHAILRLKRYAEDIIASLPAGLIVVDEALRVLSVNSSFRELFGAENGKDLATRKLEDILPLPGLQRQAQGVLAGGTAEHGINAALGEKQLRLAIAGIRLEEEDKDEEDQHRLLVVVEDVSEERKLREQARAHEARYRDLVHGLDAIVWEADAATFAFTFVSERAETILGYPVERWLAEPDFWADRTHPEDRDPTVAFYRAATAQQGSDHVFEHRAVAADGRVLWLRDIVHVVRDEAGRAELLRGVMVDITERKRAEEALRESEARFRQLVEDSPDAILLLVARRVAFASPAALRLFGAASLDELLERSAEQFVAPAYHRVSRERLDSLETGAEAIPMIEVEYVRLDGGTVPVEVVSRRVMISGQPAVQVMARDITGRKRAERALRESDERFQAAVRGSSAGIWDWNIAAGSYYLSPRFKEMLGYSDAEVASERGFFLSSLHPEDRPRVDAARLRHFEERAPYEIDYRMRRKDGRYIWCRAIGHAAWDGTGSVVRFSGSTSDIDAYKQAEEQIFKLNAELERRVAERTRQLEAANKELEAFSYSVSHDLRAPLRGIDGFSQILLNKYAGRLDETGSDYLQRIRRASLRMGELIDDLLKLSNVSRSAIKSEPVDLSRLARSILAELQKHEPDRKVTAEVQDGVEVSGDPRLLKIALENLLGNAWKFTGKKDDAKIRFEAREQDGGPVVIVKDNGAGFNMKYAHKLFGAFQRLHGATEFEGTGIGLATVQRIVNLHGGSIWANATMDKGATFRFSIPRPTRGETTTARQKGAA